MLIFARYILKYACLLWIFLTSADNSFKLDFTLKDMNKRELSYDHMMCENNVSYVVTPSRVFAFVFIVTWLFQFYYFFILKDSFLAGGLWAGKDSTRKI